MRASRFKCVLAAVAVFAATAFLILGVANSTAAQQPLSSSMSTAMEKGGESEPIPVETESHILPNPEGTAARSTGMGYSVAIDGDIIAVGEPWYPNNPSSDQRWGRVHLFHRVLGDWYPEGTLEITDHPPGNNAEQFGTSVALDGDTLVVGAPDDGPWPDNPDCADCQGAVYVYSYDQGAGTWNLEQRIMNPGPLGYGYEFGQSVAIDGHLIVVGSPGGIDRVHVYRWDQWQQTWIKKFKTGPSRFGAYLEFGSSVAISHEPGVGGTIVVGAPGWESSTATPDMGCVHAFDSTTDTDFTFDPADCSFKPGDSNGDRLGTSVAIYGDTIVAGAPSPSAITPAGYVYVRQDSTWYKLSSTDLYEASRFGASVAVAPNDDGAMVVVVGAPGQDNDPDPAILKVGGALHEFKYGTGTWTETRKLLTEDYLDQPGQELGCAVALQQDTIVGGASHWSVPGDPDDIGRAFVYGYNIKGKVLLDPARGYGQDRDFADSIVVATDTSTQNVVASTSINENGMYFLYVDPAVSSNVTVMVDLEQYLYAEYGPVSVSYGYRETLPDVTLLGGDMNDTNDINITDIAIISNLLGTTNPAGDLNRDGSVNITDIVAASNHFGLTSPTQWQ